MFEKVELWQRVKLQRKERRTAEGTTHFIYGVISVRFNVAPYFQLKKLVFLFNILIVFLRSFKIVPSLSHCSYKDLIEDVTDSLWKNLTTRLTTDSWGISLKFSERWARFNNELHKYLNLAIPLASHPLKLRPIKYMSQSSRTDSQEQGKRQDLFTYSSQYWGWFRPAGTYVVVSAGCLDSSACCPNYFLGNFFD